MDLSIHLTQVLPHVSPSLGVLGPKVTESAWAASDHHRRGLGCLWGPCARGPQASTYLPPVLLVPQSVPDSLSTSTW